MVGWLGVGVGVGGLAGRECLREWVVCNLDFWTFVDILWGVLGALASLVVAPLGLL